LHISQFTHWFQYAALQKEHEEVVLAKNKLEKDLQVASSELEETRRLYNQFLLKNTLVQVEYDEYKQRTQQEIDQSQALIKKLQLERVLAKQKLWDAQAKIVQLKGNIRTFIRIKPSKEGSDGIVIENSKSIRVQHANGSSAYEFEHIFESCHNQEVVFAEVQEFIESCMFGHNVTILAYGQTGSGKTYTMRGRNGSDEGILPRAIKLLLDSQETLRCLGYTFNITMSCVEVYNDECYDLLTGSRRQLEVQLSASSIFGLKVEQVTDEQKMRELIKRADCNRSTASTRTNDMSSRSHAIYRINLSVSNSLTNDVTESSLALVDLAGSERCKESGVTGARLAETTAINKSLLALQNVISARLAKFQQNVTYRDRTLTKCLSELLRPASAKILMIVTLSPEDVSQSRNSLEFASKAYGKKGKTQIVSQYMK
jgi:hypothetical protein